MAYCVIGDVNARIARVGALSATTALTETQGEDIVDGVAADIDGRLAVLGISGPVTTPAAAVAYLKNLNVWGAASEILKARLPSSQGPAGDRGAWTFWEKRYQDGLASLEAVMGGLVGQGASAGHTSSYTTRNPTKDEDLGANANPGLTINEAW